MGREELKDVLEIEREFDGHFYGIKDALIIAIWESLYELQSVKKIRMRATTDHVRKFLTEEFHIKHLPCY